MVNEDKLLQDFFSASFEHQVVQTTSAEDWVFIQKGISRKRFLKFSPSRFNIYYAVAIFLSFFFSAAVGIHYLFFLEERESSIVKPDQNHVQLQTPDLPVSEPEINTVPEPEKPEVLMKTANSLPQEKDQSEATVINLHVEPVPESEEQDTTLSSKNEELPDDIITMEEPEVKKVILYKQDTIINYDSIKVKRGFWLFKK